MNNSSYPNALSPLRSSTSGGFVIAGGPAGNVRLEVPRPDPTRLDNVERLQLLAGTTHTLDVTATATASPTPAMASASRVPDPTPPLGNVLTSGGGPQAAGRPMGLPSRGESPIPARASSTLPRSITLPPRPPESGPPPPPQQQQQQYSPALTPERQSGQQGPYRLHKFASQPQPQQQQLLPQPQPQQQQQQLQRWPELLPSPGPHGGSRTQLRLQDERPLSAGRRQQQQQQQQQQQPEHLIPSLPLSGGSPGAVGWGYDGRAGTGAGGGGGGGGCYDDVLAWDPLLAQGESRAASPTPPFGGHSLFPATAAVQQGGGGGGISPGSPYLAAAAAVSLCTSSQVLLPPLLMRAPAASGGPDGDGAEAAMVFFGPGALPGLLSGTSPSETGAGSGGAGSRVLAGPMFLHVVPSAAGRQQINGMVPTVVSVLPNDDDTASLCGAVPSAEAVGGGGGGGGATSPLSGDGGGSASTLMPSGAATLASYNGAQSHLGLGSSAAAAGAGAGPDPHDSLVASGSARHQLSKHHQGAGSWLLSSMFGKSGGNVEEKRSSKAGVLSTHETLAGGAGAGGARSSTTGFLDGASAPTASNAQGRLSAALLQQQQQQQPQQQQQQLPQEQQPLQVECPAGASNVSLAALRPFNTSTQVPVDHLLVIDGNPLAAAETHAAAAAAAAGGGGGTRGGGGEAAAAAAASSLAGGEPVAAGDVAQGLPSGWVMTPNGGGTSRRFSRAAGSVHGSRKVSQLGARSSNASRDRSVPGVLDVAAAVAMAAGDAHAAAGQANGGGGSGGGGEATMTCGAPPASSPSRQASNQRQHHFSTKKSAVRPFSADDLCSRSLPPPGSGGSGGGAWCGGSDSGCGGTAGSALSRWKRAARAAGLTASIARSFRTLRNQHDENLVREDQLQVVGEIGAGSFARVDKCMYTPADGGKPFLVAVKRIKPEMLLTSRDPEDLQLFIQEAQLLRKLNHPHIVKYIGLGIVAEAPGGGGGGGGGEKPPSLDAEKLMELSRRSWGTPKQQKRWRAAAAAAAGGGGRAPSRRHRSMALRQQLLASSPAGAGAGAGAGPFAGGSDGDEDDEERAPPPPPPLLRGVYIVEEFLGGGTLKGAVYQQMLRPQQQLYSNATALRWMAQVAGALSYMHTCRPKVLHRDIKLDNVLLQPPPQPPQPPHPQPPSPQPHTQPQNKAASGTGAGTSPPSPTQQHPQPHKQLKDLASLPQYDRCIAKLGDLGLAALLSHHRRSSIIGSSDLEVEDAQAFHWSPSMQRLASQASVAVRQRVSAATQASPHLRQAKDAAGLSRMLESHKRDRLGTYMYMAPEVYQRQKYDEKCDCFSFAVLLYEVFHRFITACSLENTTQMEKYARQVSQGFRPSIHEDIPGPLRRVIKQCWSQDPSQRPDMATVARELWDMEARGVVAALDRKQQRAAGLMGACCCVVS
ncbi:hypothetical protein PLESTF_000335400 [Pleodorina starrii]|nr:hypothetical protein PLESTF_000335400 [Pleodorina starrii]